MLNIFNLFLFLLGIWIIFLLLSNQISWLYLLLGIICSGLVSIASYHLKLIDKKSELLYLSIGFYHHFILLYFKNFFNSLKLIFSLNINSKCQPSIHIITIDNQSKYNPALLASTINMTAGLFCLLIKNNKIFIHCLNQEFFNQFNLNKTIKILNKINDDNLV